MAKITHRGQAKDKPIANNLVYTPTWLIDKIWEWAEVKSGTYILDPCAGDGRMIDRFTELAALKNIHFISTEYEIMNTIHKHYFDAIHTRFPHTDFLCQFPPVEKFDLAIMNPPFSNLGAWRFINQIYNHWLSPAGRIISIVPNYILDNADGRKQWLADHIHRMAFLPKTTFAPAVPVLHASVIEIRPKAKMSGVFKYFNSNS